jgi:hypothetical protein
VTAVASVLVGSVRCVYSCQSRRAWLGSTSPCSSQGSGRWRGHEFLVHRAAKFVADSGLGIRPGSLGSAGPRLFGLLLADI